MPRRKSEYLSGRGFSTFFSLVDAIPDVIERLPDTAIDSLKKTAEEARAQHENETPRKTGKLRDQVNIVGYKNGSLAGTVYVQWTATDERSGFHYGIVQEQGRAGDYLFVDYTTPGTGPGFMKATHDTIAEKASSQLAEDVQDLIEENSV